MNFGIYYREDDPLVEGVTQFHYLEMTLERMENDFP